MILNKGGGLGGVGLTWTFEQGDEDGHISPKKNFLHLYSFKGRKKNHFGLKTQMKRVNGWMTRIISLLIDLDTMIYYQFKNLLDKDFLAHPGIFRPTMGIHFIVDWQQIF